MLRPTAVALLGVWGVLCGVTAWAVGRLARRASEAFMERVDQARQSERAFISNASHELNNPLTAIQGECEITLLREHAPLGRVQQELCRGETQSATLLGRLTLRA